MSKFNTFGWGYGSCLAAILFINLVFTFHPIFNEIKWPITITVSQQDVVPLPIPTSMTVNVHCNESIVNPEVYE